MASDEGIRPDRSGPLPLHLDDEVRLKRPHPCGSDRWLILRVGADLRLQCRGCQRIILVPRAEFERRVARIYPAPHAAPR